MKINLTHTFMTMVAMGTCLASAQQSAAQNYGGSYYNASRPAAAPAYQAPARWNQYRAVQNKTLDEADSLVENLPAPMGSLDASPSDRGMQLSVPERVPTPAPQIERPRVDRSLQAPMSGQPYGHSPQPAPHSHPIQSAPTVSPHAHSSHAHSQHHHGQQSAIYGSPYSSMDQGLITESQPTYSSPYQSAMSIPHDGSCGTAACGPVAAPARPQLYPWFASANVLFLDLETGRGNKAFRGYDWTTSLVDPHDSVGFDTQIGRYLGCGRYGLGVRYFGWNPGEESVLRDIPVTTATNTNQTAMPHYDDIGYNDGGPDGQQSLTDHIDGHIGDGVGTPMANGRAASRLRLRRDLSFNSLEVNLFSFGLMGAQRVAFGGCDNSMLGRKHGGRYGFGGATGPLARSCSPRVRVVTSHGFRWFQAEDEFEYAYNIDGVDGYGDDDIYDNFRVENNLYGYQFGSFLTYCLGNRLNLNIGGKIGIYGNDVDVDHRIGSRTLTAYDAADNTNRTDRHASDTVLASLGELDLGLGYRINNAWTVQGGYKLLGMTGVANAVDSYPDYDSVRELHVRADNSYLIHGAYAGLAFNW